MRATNREVHPSSREAAGPRSFEVRASPSRFGRQKSTSRHDCPSDGARNSPAAKSAAGRPPAHGHLHLPFRPPSSVETLGRARRRLLWVSCTSSRPRSRGRGGRGRRPENYRHGGHSQGTPVFACKGENSRRFTVFHVAGLEWPDGSVRRLLVDDGGDATLLCTKASSREVGHVAGVSTRRGRKSGA